MTRCETDHQELTALVQLCRESEIDQVRARLERVPKAYLSMATSIRVPRDPGKQLDVPVSPCDRVERVRTCLTAATEAGAEPLVCLLLDRDADPNATGTRTQRSTSAVAMAATRGRLSILARLIERRADPDGTSAAGFTAMRLACQNGHVGVVRFLLEHKAQLDRIETDGFTALHVAASFGQADCVRCLLAHGADARLRHVRDTDALFLAIVTYHPGCVSALLPVTCPDPAAHEYVLDGTRMSALAVACGRTFRMEQAAESAELVHMLIDASPTIRQRSVPVLVDTPLGACCKAGNRAIFALLCERNADPTCVDSTGSTLMHVVADYGRSGLVDAIVHELQRRSCAINEVINSHCAIGSTPLMRAVVHHHEHVVFKLLEHRANPTSRYSDSNLTAIHMAVTSAQSRVVAALVDASKRNALCQLAAPHEYVRTAVQSGDLATVRALISRIRLSECWQTRLLAEWSEANINPALSAYVRSAIGWSALMHAAYERDLRCVVRLLRTDPDSDPRQVLQGLDAVRLAASDHGWGSPVCVRTLRVLNMACHWSPRNNVLFPPMFRSMVRTILRVREHVRRSMLFPWIELPTGLWLEIVRWLPRNVEFDCARMCRPGAETTDELLERIRV